MIKGRSQRDNTGWIYVSLAVVARFNFLQVESVFDSRPLIQFPQIVSEIRVVLNAANVTFEMAVIDQVKPQQGWENAPIRLGDAIAGQVAACAEHGFQSI